MEHGDPRNRGHAAAYIASLVAMVSFFIVVCIMSCCLDYFEKKDQQDGESSDETTTSLLDSERGIVKAEPKLQLVTDDKGRHTTLMIDPDDDVQECLTTRASPSQHARPQDYGGLGAQGSRSSFKMYYV